MTKATDIRAKMRSLCRLLVADAEDLHVVVGAAADDEVWLAPIATEDPIGVAGKVVKRNPEGSDVPHLDERIV